MWPAGAPEKFDALWAHDRFSANKFLPDEHDFSSNPNRDRQASAPGKGLVLLPFCGGARHRVPVAATRGEAETGIQTNSFLTPVQRLERQHLQAAHESRLRFAEERHPPFTNGLYGDFRAVIQTRAEDADPAKGTRIRCWRLRAGRHPRPLTTDRGSPKPDAWRGVHEDVLFIAGSETDDGTLWFPEFGLDGKPIPESGLRS